MKAKRYITAMLIPAFIGTLTINAQSANSRSSKDRTRTTNTTQVRGDKENRQTAYKTPEKSKETVQKRTDPRQNRNTSRANVQKQSNGNTNQNYIKRTNHSVSSQNKTHKPEERTNHGVSKQREQYRSNSANNQRNNTYAYRETSKTQTYRDPRNVSVSNNHNPRSTYNKPATTVYRYDKVNRHHATHKNYNKHYYGGKHYHYVYPTRTVKMNYHYDTHHHHYRALYYPAHMDIYWTRNMYRNYARMYPTYEYWHYGYGHRISTISTFAAAYNMGEVARVYGRVYSSWYNRDTDDFLLFFGGDYPQQNFTLVVPGNIARRYNRRPDQYFLGRHITATGLITSFEGKPEMVIKQKGQIALY